MDSTDPLCWEDYQCKRVTLSKDLDALFHPNSTPSGVVYGSKVKLRDLYCVINTPVAVNVGADVEFNSVAVYKRRADSGHRGVLCAGQMKARR